MDWSNQIAVFLGDERLLFNLIAIHVAIGGLMIASVVSRSFLQSGGERFSSWFGMQWLRGVTQEATQTVRGVVYWLMLTLMAGAIAGGAMYHLAGRDVRSDAVSVWREHLTGERLLALGLGSAKLIGICVGGWIAFRFVRRVRRRVESAVLATLPQALEPEGELHIVADAERQPKQGDTVRRWFDLLERYALLMIVLGAAWWCAEIVGAGSLASVVRFVVPLASILFQARLLAMSAKTISRALVAFGTRQFAPTSLRPYWERVTRVFPFGEKCFEAVVYVWAAARGMQEVGVWSEWAKERGPQAIQCIGIFFTARVLIELLHVLLNEAFGMYDERRSMDQKGQTLVPLLQSAIQYAVYFGASVVILEVVNGPTQTILAGAGLLGLAVGLGAQSFVGDLVSGFFILFENQYLVGDVVQIGDANGKVEAVSIRTTQIRDEQGRVYIVPNGQIKSVVNFSKGFVNAVVDVKSPTSADVDQLLRDMEEAGRRLKTRRKEVLAETVIKGMVELTPSDMTLRAVTRVAPGTHAAMQNEYRRLLKEVLDERRPARAAA